MSVLNKATWLRLSLIVGGLVREDLRVCTNCALSDLYVSAWVSQVISTAVPWIEFDWWLVNRLLVQGWQCFLAGLGCHSHLKLNGQWSWQVSSVKGWSQLESAPHLPLMHTSALQRLQQWIEACQYTVWGEHQSRVSHNLWNSCRTSTVLVWLAFDQLFHSLQMLKQEPRIWTVCFSLLSLCLLNTYSKHELLWERVQCHMQVGHPRLTYL